MAVSTTTERPSRSQRGPLGAWKYPDEKCATVLRCTKSTYSSTVNMMDDSCSSGEGLRAGTSFRSVKQLETAVYAFMKHSAPLSSIRTSQIW